ncbi:PLP-dependent transferase [Xylariaceae sp. FL0594]|nr:PLP-dependent transferase [Xylariaceae sp. FL0594]
MDSQTAPVFGQRLLQHFEFDPEYRNLNHGSFGTAPREVREHMRRHQRLYEAAPDRYLRYEYPALLDECRAAVARFVGAPADTVVFVPNATTGVNTVLQNLAWAEDAKDEILYFSTVYAGCGKAIDYIVDRESGRVSSRAITVSYPCEDEVIVQSFHAALADSARAGKRVRLCVFDTVSSLPGVRFPFEAITQACRDAGILSLVDGAQGVGMVSLDLGALDPDFFVSNCHKWLFVPRSCAVFYVPLRNQHLIKATLPPSHGYVPKTGSRFNPLPPSPKPAFISNFEFVGTVDNSAFVCVKEAIEWRRRVLGGEEAIMQYTQSLAREGGKRVAGILGTEVLDNESGTLTKCAMTNVALPIDPGVASVETQDRMLRTMVNEFKTFIPLIIHGGKVWARLSAQVYLGLEDFDWAGHMLLELCRRVRCMEKGKL